MRWEKATTSSQLEDGAVLFKHPPKQIALFKAGDRVYAVDNRCPHEGYPLKEGTLDGDRVLTCKWHNWKFRLSDGRCLLGGDGAECFILALGAEAETLCQMVVRFAAGCASEEHAPFR